MPPLPTTPGVEATGHIAEIRAGVEGLRVGDPVFVYPWKIGGCYAEYIAARRA
jgi:NADPH:quinone reductase-like Zn-dependent oxidoreductase